MKFSTPITFLLCQYFISPIQAATCQNSPEALAEKLTYIAKTAIYTTTTYIGVRSACRVFLRPAIEDECSNIAAIAASGTAVIRTYFEGNFQGRRAEAGDANARVRDREEL
jgi:hypothetical protein